MHRAWHSLGLGDNSLGLADSGQRGIVLQLDRQHWHDFIFHGVSDHAIIFYCVMIQTGASSAPLPARTTHRLPVLEAFSLMAAACAALAFLPYIVHSGTSVAPVRCAHCCYITLLPQLAFVIHSALESFHCSGHKHWRLMSQSFWSGCSPQQP